METSYSNTVQRIKQLKQELSNDVISFDEQEELNDELDSLTELRVQREESFE